jgi:putative hydrolase
MSGNLPFGFGSSDREPSEPGNPADFFGQLPGFAEIAKLLSWSGGPVNWDLAKQIAMQSLSGANPGITPADHKAVGDALRLADLWLDAVTDLPSGIQVTEAWTRLQWVERTLPVWSALCEPVAAHVTSAMGSVLPTDQLQMFGGADLQLGQFLNQAGGFMFGAQLGQGLGALALEVVSVTDVGIPLGPIGVAALVPENVTAFGAGLERPEDEVRLYLALREAAHQRLFSHVPWLKQRLLDTVEGYSRGIHVDMSAIEQAMSSVDPSNPESVQNALNDGLFSPEQTPEQAAALRRLETLLALVEGWVDAVVAAAAADRMPGAEALREASRRRRAEGGPAEQTFATLVGLELRPRRLREAAALWWGVTERHGVAGRDGVWAHPDLLPTADDLDDPLGFAETLGSPTSLDFDLGDEDPTQQG